MSHKQLPPPIGAVVCDKCFVLVAHVTHDDPITINDMPYEFENPLTHCGTCGEKLKQLSLTKYKEDGSLYKHKRGNNGY